jgi:hypothetical protein
MQADLNKSLQFLMAPEWNAKIVKAIADAKFILSENIRQGIIDAANTSAIEAIIARAEKYRKTAAEIAEYWKYYHTSSKAIGLWPLELEKPKYNCQTNGGKIQYVSNLGTMEIVCPSPIDEFIHNKDREMFRDLMLAALYNARCAQEGAAAVGVYYQNKKVADARPSGKKDLLYSPNKVSRPPTSSLGAKGLLYNPQKAKPAPDLEEGAPNLGEELVEEEAATVDGESGTTTVESSTPKKKDNTIMIVGAAAVVGLLMMKGRS